MVPSLILLLTILSVSGIFSAEKLITDTMGSYIQDNSSTFLFNAEYLFSELEVPTKVDIYINNSKWATITSLHAGMNDNGLIGDLNVGCTNPNFPTLEIVNLSLPLKTGDVYGFNAASVKYVATYSDASTVTKNAVAPVVLYNDNFSYIENEAEILSYCGIDLSPVVGGDADEHGCIGSAGYSWCESKQKCLRVWEEDCPATETIQNQEEEQVQIQEQVQVQEINTVQSELKLGIADGTNLSSVLGFAISNDEAGMIKFHNSLNLSAEETVQKMNSLNDYVSINTGVIEIDSESLGILANEPATLTMTGLNFNVQPMILVDGEQDTEGIVSNIEYDVEAGVLTFDVAHFTKFEAVENVPEMVLDDSEITEEESVATVGNSELEHGIVAFEFALCVVLVVGVISVVFYGIYSQRKEREIKKNKKYSGGIVE